MLKSVTRHVHIMAAEITADDRWIDREDLLTLDVDPDNELIWNDEALQQVYNKFDELVASYEGRDLIDYNLRRIGSDLEHFIRSLLQEGKLAYNMSAPSVNYSMGFPQVPLDTVKQQQFVPEE